MNVSRIIAGVAVCILSCQLCWSQEKMPVSPHRALGYFDESSGVFRPVGQMDYFDSNSLAAANPQTGTIVVNFTIAIKSAIPTSSQITCDVTTGVTEISGGEVNLISDDVTVAATRTGSTAKCTVTIPYSWALSNPANASVSLSFVVTAKKPTAATTAFMGRLSIGTIANLPIPANGATTTQTVNTVL